MMLTHLRRHRPLLVHEADDGRNRELRRSRPPVEKLDRVYVDVAPALLAPALNGDPKVLAAEGYNLAFERLKNIMNPPPRA